MDPRTEIGEFLRSRRARIAPDGPGYGRRRRVPGLRREEVAALADVSVTYYARIERGDVAGVSDVVLRAIARALRLDEIETAHLLALAAAVSSKPRPRGRETVRPGVQAILDAFESSPAWVSNQRMDFLAGNALGRALYSDMLVSARGNNARYVFLTESSREFYRDWDDDADDVVGILRHYTALRPADRELGELITELRERSEAFRDRWAAHRVRFRRTGSKRVRHRIAGELDLLCERLHFPGDDDLSVFVHPVERGSDTAHQLALLTTYGSVGYGTVAGIRELSE